MDEDYDQASENPYYALYPKIPNAWLYIVIDIRDLTMSKIGLTTNEHPMNRISQGKTYNPFLMLFATYELSKCTFGISLKELQDIEGYLHGRSTFGGAIKHLQSGRESEWFYTHPEEAEYQVDIHLAKRGFSVDGKTLYTVYEGYQQHGDIVIERMRKIKTIIRPNPEEFYLNAVNCGLQPEQFRPYYDYLLEYHSRDAIAKVYL
ncbi:hypothetical protein BVJ64_18160 [Vibrio cholerae]|uniref:hypothetical protein n=1 Tax=Vibrio cholerae TaxID=666 RepID=UPI00096BCDE2|nr:hypothetical protein [Vibrio cholerae]MBO1405385.1 hypothetical protein [Vibrio cholerae]WOQ95305.1 hypothetical protein R4533_14690 [Vibrio cholerae]